MPYPTALAQVKADLQQLTKALRGAGVPQKLLNSVATKALRSGRRLTGIFQSNRNPRWQLNTADPQYSTELDAHIILVRLLGMLLQFKNPPTVNPVVVQMLETNYFFHPIIGGTYKDALLLEELDYLAFEAEQLAPKHGHSNFHIGHQDPLAQPKHAPDNIYWRTFRSNLIQGNMTLREARVYIIKLIGRYFELGELPIT